MFDDIFVIPLTNESPDELSIFPDISMFHERAGEPQSLRWPERSWPPSYSVWSTWCPSTSRATQCSTTAQFRTLKKRWVVQGGWQRPSACFQINDNCFNQVVFFPLSALNLARAASIPSRSWRGPCSSWVYMTPPSVMWRISLLIRYWSCKGSIYTVYCVPLNYGILLEHTLWSSFLASCVLCSC